MNFLNLSVILWILNRIMPEIEAFTHVNAVANPCREDLVADFALIEFIFRVN